MTTIQHEAYGTLTTVLSTEFNSLANNANTALSGAFDNSTAKDLFCDVVVNVAAQGSARSAGAIVTLYICPAIDGTNYDDANETTAEVWAVIPLDAATTARQRTVRDVPMPPASFKVFARNSTGQALAASGSTVKIRVHSLDQV